MSLTIEGLISADTKTITHISYGTYQIQKISYFEPIMDTGSDITFLFRNFSGGYWEYYPSLNRGSATETNSDLSVIRFFDTDYTRTISASKYETRFLDSFLRTKIPIAIEVDNTSYNLSLNIRNGLLEYQSPVITLASNDRVSDSDLTKNIDFELVDNIQVNLPLIFDDDQYHKSFSSEESEVFSSVFYQGQFGNVSRWSQKWVVFFRTAPTKTPTHIVVNGREYPIIADTLARGYLTRDTVTDATFIPTFNPSYIDFGINVKFSDGTYALDTRSKLFRTGGLKEVWSNINPPAITAFSVSPNNVDLDIADNEPTASVTFRKRSEGIYEFISSQYTHTPNDVGGPVTGFNSLVTILHYYINAPGRLGGPTGPPANSHYYQFSVRNTDPNYQLYNAIEINGRTFNLNNSGTDFTEHGITGREYWTTSQIPNSADWVADGRLTLNIKFKLSKVIDKIAFNVAITGTATQTTTAQVYLDPQGTKVGVEYSGANGANITQSIPNIDRPNQTQRYRLVATNTGGSSHQDVTVTITQNATITNLRRTGFSQRADGTRFQFTARITGYPRPTVTWRFGNGRQSQRANDSIHFTAVSGQVNTWDAVWGVGAGIIHPVTNDSLVWTVTNSSNTKTDTISNISSR